MFTPGHASFDEEGKNKSHALNVIVDESTSASLAHGIRQPDGSLGRANDFAISR